MNHVHAEVPVEAHTSQNDRCDPVEWGLGKNISISVFYIYTCKYIRRLLTRTRLFSPNIGSIMHILQSCRKVQELRTGYTINKPL